MSQAPFKPTAEQRIVVKMLAAILTPHEEIAKAIINPGTKNSISPVTLRAHFAEELENGLIQVKAFTLGKLFKLVQKETPSAIYFLLKTKFGFKETMSHEHLNLGTFDLSRLTDAELDDLRAGRLTDELIQRIKASAAAEPAGPREAGLGGGSGAPAAGQGEDGGAGEDGGGRAEPLADPSPQ